MSLRPLSSVRGPYYYTLDDVTFRVTLNEPGRPERSVPEALVQDLWKKQSFSPGELATVDGAAVQVLSPGRQNTDAGPDFTNARLRVDGVEWAGSVEVHLTSSDWHAHAHQRDDRYNSVILHVVLHADLQTGALKRPDGTPLPELVLFPHLQTPLRRLLHRYYTGSSSPDLLCASRWREVPAPTRAEWIRHLARERLSSKRNQLARRFRRRPDLETLLHERLFAGLGYAKNAEAMTTLARHLPLSIVRSIPDPFDLEALHLGVSGLLPSPEDLLETDRATADYAVALKDRFHRLNQRLQRPVMPREAWLFLRLRPANFPPVRIAQAAALFRSDPPGLLHRRPVEKLINAITSNHPRQALRSHLRATPMPFWETHVRLTKRTRPRSARIGRTRIDTLLVNAIAPVLLLAAELHDRPDLVEAAYGLLEDLPPSRDSVTKHYRDLGTSPANAFESQGLHQLYRTRCTSARCLDCAIGRILLERGE